MSTEQPPQPQTSPEMDTLDVQMAAARLSAASSNTSVASGRTVIVPEDLNISPQVLAEALNMYQQRNKRQRTNSGDEDQSSSKKKRPLMGEIADALYKKARNSLGKMSRHHAMLQGLNKYIAFGDHIVPPSMKVDIFSSLHFLSLYLNNTTQNSVFPPTNPWSQYLSIQVKNTIPNGMGDERLSEIWNEIVKATERRFLEAQIEYATRVRDHNEGVYNDSISKLKTELGSDNDTYQQCIAAAERCSEIHRTREQGKQMKQWTLALTLLDAGAVSRGRNNRANKPKRQNQRGNNGAPTAGPSNPSPRGDNGRTTMRAQRRLPGNNQNNRGRHQQNNDAKMGKAIRMVVSAMNDE